MGSHFDFWIPQFVEEREMSVDLPLMRASKM